MLAGCNCYLLADNCQLPEAEFQFAAPRCRALRKSELPLERRNS